MKVLVLGSGGREQALAWKIAQSFAVTEVILAPGNAGIPNRCKRVYIDQDNHNEVAELVRKEGIELLVIGPEQPLVDGLVDYLKAQPDLSRLHIVGPTAEGARLEGSKDFAKSFMLRHGIPTARYKTFFSKEVESAQAYLRAVEKAPYVLKADGLAAGKGVLILDNVEEACHAIDEMLGGKYGKAGNQVVVETYLDGIECSVFVLTDGAHYQILPVAKDYKRIGEGDRGLNTGGMGAVSPVSFADDEFMKKVEERIVRPTVEGLQREQIDYRGFIFIGLMNVGGEPYVIEYNCRMGDPETEAVMLRISSDIVPALMALKDQTLDKVAPITHSDNVAVTVIATSGGYPEAYRKGYPIRGLDKSDSKALVFHAGTEKLPSEEIVTNGGRVLAVSAEGSTISEALQTVYDRMSELSFEGMYFRRDIGQDLLS